MKEFNTDINIIGGGLIGAALALSLSDTGLTICILEKNTQFNPNNTKLDKRTVAISEGTKNFLEKIGVWKDIKQLSEPIKNIKIIDRKINNIINFDNDRRKSNLGYIVKNTDLMTVFYKQLSKKKNVKLINNIKINKIENSNNCNILYSNKVKINSKLNVAADGKNSFVKKIYKTTFYSKKYNKDALVINLSHSSDHKNTAYEFFFNEGPLAILPMKKINGINYSSIVWTSNSEYFTNLVKLDEKKIISIINKKIEYCIGDIKKILSIQKFPLSAHLNTKFYEHRTVYVGDSAHSVHPIAGQGWNLGMSDVESLYELVKKYCYLGIDIGDINFCKTYHHDNFYKAYRLYQVTDKLDNIFKFENQFIFALRSLGLKLVQSNKAIKEKISDFAMGIN